MRPARTSPSERIVILTPGGRDPIVAKSILHEACIQADICAALGELVEEIERGADCALVTEEALHSPEVVLLANWVSAQPPWSDFPFILLTQHGGGLERNPAAIRFTEVLGNVSFLERPFHPTTLVSLVQTHLRGRRRQYENRRLNDEQESRVQERTSELAAANRQLLGQIEERERVEMTLRQMQRLEAVGQLTSGVAHDFNNLLTVVLGNIGFLERGLAGAGIDGKLSKRLGYMRIAAERGAKLTDQLLSFSRRQRLEPKALDLNHTIAGMRDLLQSTIGGSIVIESNLASGLWPALVDPTQFDVAILNLAINARDAMPGGGKLEVATRNVTLGDPLHPQDPPAGDYVDICVSDTGTGMPPEVQAKAFEPFFTTKDVGKGSGLGLSQVLGFAKQSGGGVRIHSEPSRGTAIRIYLPRAAAGLASLLQPAHASDHTPGASASILLVDDDNAVREVTAATLRDLGYQVIEAGSGGAALELLDQHPDIHLMLIDFTMPGMSGDEVFRRVRIKRPALPVLFITGFADRAAIAGIGESRIISKPFLNDELTDKIQQALLGGTQDNVTLLPTA